MRRRKDLVIYLKDYRMPSSPRLASLYAPHTSRSRVYVWESLLLLTLLSVGAASLFFFNHRVYELMGESAIFIN